MHLFEEIQVKPMFMIGECFIHDEGELPSQQAKRRYRIEATLLNPSSAP